MDREIAEIGGGAAEAIAARGQLGQGARDVDEVLVGIPALAHALDVELENGGGEAAPIEDGHPTWIIASGDGVAGFGCDRPPAWCPAGRYGLLAALRVQVISLPSASPFRSRLPAVLAIPLALAWPAAPTPPPSATRPPSLDRLRPPGRRAKKRAGWAPGARGTRARHDERDYIRERWAGEESRLEIERPSEVLRSPFKVPATATSITEPRGRVEQAIFTLERGPDGWAVTDRQVVSQIDGLVHLSLGPAFRADGLALHLPDFDIRFRRGTLFLPPATLGPTVLVFIGDATVRFVPSPATEKEQLRQFSGRPELLETVHAVFIRIHPADFHRVFRRRRAAAGPHGKRGARPEVLRSTSTAPIADAPLPRAPWWLILLGEPWSLQARRGTPFTLSQSERRREPLRPRPPPPGVSTRPPERRPASTRRPAGRRPPPRPQRALRRTATAGGIRHAPRACAPRQHHPLALDEALKVIYTSREGGDHLFFRVRHQDGMIVSLGTRRQHGRSR